MFDMDFIILTDVVVARVHLTQGGNIEDQDLIILALTNKAIEKGT